ncbi:hypothetical protein [Streptosporangium sp. NPDC048865]|uniref:hypothetical protein n=1 Tax=Streptosporangium sp. NPDC048865 TaxID=3155766 RepID=UPI0034363921
MQVAKIILMDPMLPMYTTDNAPDAPHAVVESAWLEWALADGGTNDKLGTAFQNISDSARGNGAQAILGVKFVSYGEFGWCGVIGTAVTWRA